MKIALAVENFSVRAGGAESYAVELAKTLVREGWEAHLYGHSWDGEPQGAIFHRIRRLPRVFPPSLRLMSFALSHSRLVRQERFDVIVGFGATIVMNVYQSHGGVHVLTTKRKSAVIRNPALRMLKTAIAYCTPKHAARRWIESAPFRMGQRPIIVAISDLVAADMTEYFRVPRNEIRLLYNGIDLNRFGRRDAGLRETLRKDMGVGAKTVFLFMSYDLKKKGAHTLVEASGILRDRFGKAAFEVFFVGGMPYPALSRRITRLRLDDTVKFLGPTDNPERMYAASDVFVLPTYYDACSLVVFEAMAAGLPCITSAHNGAAGIIHHGEDGFVLSDPTDSEELASAMARLLDCDFRERAAEAATRTVSRYSLEANHGEMIRIFEEAAGTRTVSH